MHTLQSRYSLTLTTLCLLVLALLYVPASLAQNLTDKSVRAFVEVMESMEPLQEKHKAFLDRVEEQSDDDEADLSTLMSSGIEDIKGHPVYDDLEDLVQAHGFSSVEDWAHTGDQVMNAWFALEMENQPRSMMQEMQAGMAEIENSPHLTAEQKAELKAMMQGTVNNLASMSTVPESSKKLVKPYVERLKVATKYDEEDEEFGEHEGYR